MKTFTFSRALSAIAAILVSNFAQATNYTNPGSGQSYNLYSGDTLTIYQGSYHGPINTFAQGSVIVIANGAVFNPASLSSPAGRILNYGQITMSYVGFQAGASLMNYGQANFSGGLEFYNGSTSTLLNSMGALLTVGGSFNIASLVLTNNATISINNDLNIYNTSSTVVTNAGNILIGGNLNMGGGTLNNNHTIRMTDLSVSGGTFNNAGQVTPRGNASYSGSGSYSNGCMMNTGKGLTLYSNFSNNGLLWVGNTNTDQDQFYVSGSTFMGAANSFVRANKMINYSTITGKSKFYIKASSYTSGSVGTAGSNVTDSIKVYDETRTGSNIFDTQYGTIYNNVSFGTLSLPDTTSINYSGCSATYLNRSGSSTLPVNFTSFNVKQVSASVQISWSAVYEASMKFEVERSFDNRNFSRINIVNSNVSASYTVNDKDLNDAGAVIYYRVKATAADGDVKYTEVRTVKFASSIVLAVSPNPISAASQLQFSTDKASQAVIRITNVSGQQVMFQMINTNSGKNSVGLNSTNLKAGVYVLDLQINGESVGTVKLVKN